ncbi:ubiquitin-like domain-containing protein [Neobacillus sp. 179-C4.2 HS]|uniref:Ubiquitin-like domain-containing protein n=1 Tax=Neobacillus driksii TaxID=3035913 RepID=A0ABV4Z277_9BACI|nr:G5 and 3D domain-containing protein [Neobacillus sp. 179.-C4.2 HS]MDP5197650.1 ubiquitin-like domain-containing protein [Neobacillus sp. 179.-C4.2 HS]
MKNLFSKSLSSKRLAIAFASFVVLAALLGFSYYEGSKYTVALTLNGQQKVIKTHANTVKEVFAQLEIPLNSKDYLSPSANAKVKDNQNIVWKQAKQVQIVQDNEKKTIWTTAGTVAELLKEQQIVLHEQDEISPKPEEKIKSKMDIRIKLALHLTLVDGGKEQQVWSTSATVADFLTQQGIKLNEFDRVEPSLSETLQKDGVINVIRVEKVTDVVEEPIQFAVITKKDEGLEKGKQVTVTEGKQGIVSKEYEVILENGKEVSRKIIGEQKLREKLDKVVAVGTKELDIQVSRGAETGTEFYVNTTAYTAYCNGCSGRTATGFDLRANPGAKVIAVDPRVIPLGTKVYVEGYGYAVAADTGGAIKGHKIDVFFPTKAEAFRWGVRKVKIKILQ